ncbi:MAG: DUF3347 domain-containing protein [Flavitalea sp.]
MKRLFKVVLPVAAVLILSSCGETESKDTKTEAGHDDHSTMEHKEVATNVSPVLKNDQLNAVYQHYVHLTTALTNADVAEAKVAANAIEAGAKEISEASSIASSAAKITAQSNIEEQRKIYSTLSNDMIALIKKEGMQSGEIYVDFCPMALNDAGANWISNKKEISNPYFGDKMLKCGEIKETITKN